jgi:hypothetical protein
MSKYNTELGIHGVTKITHTRIHWVVDVPHPYWVHKLLIEDSDGNEFQVTLYAQGKSDIDIVEPPVREE